LIGSGEVMRRRPGFTDELASGVSAAKRGGARKKPREKRLSKVT